MSDDNTQSDAEPSLASAGYAWDAFDFEVSAIRAGGIKPRHKPYGLNKAQCTPIQWAAHLEWRANYYQQNQYIWNFYRNKWLAKRSKVIAKEVKS